MSNQLSIFDEQIARERVLPPHRDNEASKDAAEFIEPFTASLRARVLLEIGKRGIEGATADELCVALDACRNSVAPRICELGPGTERHPGMNLICDSGKRRAVAGQSVPATVWVLNKEASE